MNQQNYESFNDTLMALAPFALLFFIIGIIACIVAIAYLIRLWLVQTATFQIQKDVEDIRNHLLGYQVEEVASDVPQAVEHGSIEPIKPKQKNELTPPRKVFLWLAVSIPVLIIGLIVAILVQN